MSEKIPISLHNSDLFLKPDLTDTNPEELNQDTFKISALKKGPSLGENNHTKPLYTSDLLPRLQVEQKLLTEARLGIQERSLRNAYFNKAITLHADSPISAESGVRKRRLESASQRSKSQTDRLKHEEGVSKTSFLKEQGQFPLRYELGSGFLLYDKAQLESQERYYLRSKSRFAENAERLMQNPRGLKKRSFFNKPSFAKPSKHTSAPLTVKVVNPVETEKKAITKLEETSFVNQLFYPPVYKERSLSYKSKVLLRALPSLIRSGISREFLLVTINLLLLSILATVHRNNYGKGFFPIISKRSDTTHCVKLKKQSFFNKPSFLITLFCNSASKTPNISSSLQNVLHHQVSQNLEGSWQYLNRIKPGHLSFVLHRKLFTVPWQDQKQERFIGVFLGEQNINSRVTDDLDRSSKHKQIGSANGEEILLSLPEFHVSKTVSHQTSLNKDLKKQSFFYSSPFKPIAGKSLSFRIEKKPLLPFDRENYVSCQWESFAQVTKVPFKPLLCHFNLRLTRTPFWLTNLLLPAKLVDCVIKPWYCMKAYKTENDTVVATRYVQKRVNNGTVYRGPKIKGFQCCMPYYTSQERIFAESDTIPSKRRTVCSQTVNKLNLVDQVCYNFGDKLNLKSDQLCVKEVEKQKFVKTLLTTPQNSGFAKKKVQLSEFDFGRSSVMTSQILLKRCFYKYGFFLISPEKKISISKKELNYLTKSPYINDINLLRGVTETQNHTVDQAHDQGEALTQSNYYRATPKRIQVNVKSSCIPGDHINLTLYKNINTSYVESFNQRVAPVSSKPSFLTETSFNKACLNRNLFVRNDFHTVKIGKHSPVFTKSDNSNKSHGRVNNRSIKRVSFPLTYAWSKYNISKVKPNAFTKAKGSISTFNFIPDILVQNSCVSGYKFPGLKKKEIVYLFRQRAILDSCQTLFGKHLCLHTSNKFFDKSYIKTPQILWNQVKKPFQILKSYNLIDQVLSTQGSGSVDKGLTTSFDRSKTSDLGTSSDSFNEPDLSMIDLKMQYTQVNLDSIENVKDLFSQMGRDYERYLRQPKDSLPALILSPSLEDDREIEEEGIQIFRKRDLIKNKRVRKTGNEVSENRTLAEHLFNENGDSNIGNTSFSRTQELNNFEKTESKSEIQDRQNLVKNALRQAQEEIDNIAKKEEKGSDKEKQVIPPLTRLEALYTIRNREKKREQAKDLTSSKSILSYLGLRTSKNRLHLQELQNKTLKGSRVVKNTSLPFFEELVLYPDKSHNADLKRAPEFAFKHNWILTPWLFSKVGDSICTDRKHSFFGEMSLLPKRVTAQEQKQVFQQKANPLLKVNSKKVQSVFNAWTEENVGCLDRAKQNSATPRVSLSRSFDQQRITQPNSHYQFQIATRSLPEIMSGLEGKALFTSLPSPIYSYKNISQNKACQASAPKIKGTPLVSPVSHRVWQPKRMEASTFRVSSRSQSTPVLPTIDQKDWKNMIKWQLKKYFFEEDKRLLSLNKKKNLKIKKVNLYLPWISIKRENIGNKQPFVTKPEQTTLLNSAASENEWPLTRLDFTSSDLHSTDLQDLLQESSNSKNCCLDTTLNCIKPNHKISKRIVQKESVAPCVNDLVDSEIGNDLVNLLRLPKTGALHTCFTKMGKDCYKNNFSGLSNESNLLTESISETSQNKKIVSFKSPPQQRILRGKTSNYWRLPVQQILSTVTLPLKKRERPHLSQRERVKTVNSKVKTPQKELGIRKKVCNSSILFESVTTYSWLFVYTFVFVLMFKQLFNFVYKVGFKDFFIKFLNSDFGRTVTSEEFRYSIQNSPLTESYMSKKRLQELLGLEKNQVQLLEVVWFLRNNCQGRNGPRGILLVGPPGVENVSVVQAIAGEAKVPIIVQSLEKIAQDNEPQRQLEQLYTRAHKQAPCVLFLDQLDKIGARRDQLFTNRHARNLGSTSISDKEEYNVNTRVQNLNSGNLNVVLRLLTILDGITQSSGVVTVATAQDLSKLDPALLRPKRFDRRIYLSLPNQQDRVNLLKIQTQNLGHLKEMPWDYLSLQTENMSTADIKSAINYSLFKAALKNSVHTVETLEYGIDCVKSLTNKRVKKK